MKETMEKFLNKEATFAIDNMNVDVTITDIKQSYGECKFEIKPISGSGYRWTTFNKLTLK